MNMGCSTGCRTGNAVDNRNRAAISKYEIAAQLAQNDGQYAVAAELRGLARLGGFGGLGAVDSDNWEEFSPDKLDAADKRALAADQASGSSSSWFTKENIALALSLGLSVMQLVNQRDTRLAPRGPPVQEQPRTEATPMWVWGALAVAGVAAVGFVMTR